MCQERDLPTRELTRGLYYAKTHISFPRQVPTVVVLVFGFWFKFFLAFFRHYHSAITLRGNVLFL